MRAGTAIWALCLTAATSAQAATRGNYGGTLRVALAGELPPEDALLADPPAEAAIAGLDSRPVCRLDAQQRIIPAVGQEIARPSPQEVRITLRPGLQSAGGGALNAVQIAQSWMRLSHSETRSPYRALLAPLRGEGRFLAAESASALTLPLAFAWPDLEKSLCHPALAVMTQTAQRGAAPGHGPFLPMRAPGVFTASLGYAGGRPYVDRVSITAGDARTAARALALGDADIGLGTSGDGGSALAAAPALFATYLVFKPDRTGPQLREAVERLVDRADLTRFFVRAPAVPMSSPLPPALMPQQPAPRSSPGPAPKRELTLLYDATLPDQRPVAERLQVKLHDAGYRIALRGLSRSALRTRWASGDFDLMLHAVLLPPIAGPALAVVLDLAGRRDLLGRELPPLGAIADAAARDARARERALALQPELPLLPLHAQSLRVVASKKVAGVEFDAFGVPLLDDAFFPSSP